jgi:hypothetical protein
VRFYAALDREVRGGQSTSDGVRRCGQTFVTLLGGQIYCGKNCIL